MRLIGVFAIFFVFGVFLAAFLFCVATGIYLIPKAVSPETGRSLQSALGFWALLIAPGAFRHAAFFFWLPQLVSAAIAVAMLLRYGRLLLWPLVLPTPIFSMLDYMLLDTRFVIPWTPALFLLIQLIVSFICMRLVEDTFRDMAGSGR